MKPAALSAFVISAEVVDYFALLGIAVLAGVLTPVVMFAWKALVQSHAGILAERLDTTREELRAMREVSVQRQLDADRAARPRIEVVLVRDPLYDFLYVLRISNWGATATFRAVMRVLATTVGSDGTMHNMWWERAKNIETKIVTNGEDHFKVAQLQWGNRLAMFDLALCGFDDRSARPHTFWHFGHAPGQSTPPIAELEITVSAEPQLAGGAWVQRLRLGLTSLQVIAPPFEADTKSVLQAQAAAILRAEQMPSHDRH